MQGLKYSPVIVIPVRPLQNSLALGTLIILKQRHSVMTRHTRVG